MAPSITQDRSIPGQEAEVKAICALFAGACDASAAGRSSTACARDAATSIMTAAASGSRMKPYEIEGRDL